MAINREKILEAAQKFASKRRFDKAIVEYRKLLQDQPNDDRTMLRIADSQVRMAAYDAAVGSFLEVAAYYAAEGFHAKAIAIYQQARGLVQQHLATRAEQFAHLLPKLAQLYIDQGLTGDAAVVLGEYATVLESAGRGREALDVLRQLTALRKDDLRLRMRLIDALAASGDAAGARLELGSLAEGHVAAGRRDEALQVYERMLAQRPEPMIARTIAELYLDRGLPEDGVTALNRLQICFQSTQRDPTTLRILARALDAVGQRSRATDIRKLLLKILVEASALESSRDVVAQLLVEAPDDDNVREAAISLGLIRPARPRPPLRVGRPAAPTAPAREAQVVPEPIAEAPDWTRSSRVLMPAPMAPAPPAPRAAAPTPPPRPSVQRTPPAPKDTSPEVDEFEPVSLSEMVREDNAFSDASRPGGIGDRISPRRAVAVAPRTASQSQYSSVANRRERKDDVAAGAEPTVSFRRVQKQPTTPPPDPTVSFRRAKPIASPEKAAPPPVQNQDELIGPLAALESTGPRPRADLLGAPAVRFPSASHRHDPLGSIDPTADPTIPFGRDSFETIESAASAPDPTMPFRRDSFDSVESAATGPDPTMPFRRDSFESVQSAASGPDPTMPFRRDSFEPVESAATGPDPTMPFRRDAMDIQEAAVLHPASDDEERTEETIRPESPFVPADEEAVAEVLEEVSFFESQHLLDDALALVEEQLPSFPGNQALTACYHRLRHALGITTG